MRLFILFLFPLFVLAETAPSTSVKAKLFNGAGTTGLGSVADALKVNLTNTNIPVAGTFWQTTQPVSIAAPVAVTGNFYQATQPVSISSPVPITGALTDSQLRSTPLPIVGALTNTEIRSTPLNVTGTISTGGLTDTQLRATPLPVTVTGAGDASQELQTAGNNTLTAINSKIPAPLSIVGNKLLVDGSGVVQPINGAVSIINPSLAVTGPLTNTELRNAPVPISGTVTAILPAGLATSAKQDTGNASLSSIDTKLTNTMAQDRTSSGSPFAVRLSDGTGFIDPRLVQVTSSVLPTGASTSSLQSTGNASLGSIDTKLTTTANGLKADVTSTVGLTNTQLRATPVPISGTVVTGGLTDTQLRAIAVPVSSASLPLPTGASTETTLSALNSKVTAVNTGAVTVAASVLPSGAATSSAQTTAQTSLSNIDSKITAVNTGAVVVSSSALPTGASTETTLSSINTKTPALGQALAAGSTPVVLTAAQLTTLTPLTSVSVNNLPATQVVSGTVTANTGLSQPVTDAQLRATAVPVSVSGTPSVAVTSSVLPTGAATSALQTTTNASLSSLDTKTPALGQSLAAASTPVVLTAAQLSTLTPLTSVAVSNLPATQAVSIATMPTTPVTGTFFQTTQPVSIAGTIPVSNASLPLPAGASTAANQTTSNNSLSSIDTKVPAGLTVTANRLQVELPAGASGLTDAQLRATAVPVSISGTLTTTGGLTDSQLRATAIPVSNASLPLPTGATTEATLSAINVKTPTVGQKTMAASSPIVVSSDQASIAFKKYDSTKSTYNAAINSLIVVSGATDIFTITGSNTKIVKISKLELTCTKAAANYVNIVVNKRSSANVGGTFTLSPVVPIDSIDPPSTAIVTAYTANPTVVGTLVGKIVAQRFLITDNAPGSPTSRGPAINLLETEYGKLVTLRSSSEVLAISGTGEGMISAADCSVTAQWTEE